MTTQKAGGVLVTPPPNLVQHLDWLELTFPILGNRPSVSYPEYFSKDRVETKPTNGYNTAVRYADGRIELVHTDQPKMGTHVVFSAQTLARLETDEKWLLEYFITEGAKITRLDCALDVYDYPLDFEAMWALCRSGEFECRLRKPPLRTHDAKTGDTIYFGRMKSSVCTRVYNKAAEQNVDRVWTRVETMLRHARANNAAKAMVKKNLEPASFIAGHVKLPSLAWWTDVMTMKAEKTRLDRVDGNARLSWLMNSVAPTLAKEMFLHGDVVWKDFQAHVFDELEKLKAGQ